MGASAMRAVMDKCVDKCGRALPARRRVVCQAVANSGCNTDAGLRVKRRRAR